MLQLVLDQKEVGYSITLTLAALYCIVMLILLRELGLFPLSHCTLSRSFCIVIGHMEMNLQFCLILEVLTGLHLENPDGLLFQPRQ